MKRRKFLSATGIAVAASTTSGMATVSTIYSEISSQVSLAEFPPSSRKGLNSFINNLEQNLSPNLDNSQLVKSLAMPVRIISQKQDSTGDHIVYKNKSGKYVKLSVKNGVETIIISDDILS